MTDYKVIGTKPVRADTADKVTGRAIFAPDVRLPGLLYGKVLRSPHAHAKIVSVDTKEAEALPGVHAVITGKDLPSGEKEGDSHRYLLDSVLAGDKVLYDGHPIAAVAAESTQLAEDAIRLIKIQYEPLPPVIDILEAIKESSPKLHHGAKLKSLGPDNGRSGNITAHIQHRRGDAAKGFEEADQIAEGEFKTVMVHQGYIEPHSSTAQWGFEGNLTIWTTTQGIFAIREELGRILGAPLSKIKVIPTEVGGGFGGKVRCYLEPLAALLSKSALRPVKLTMTQNEVLRASGPTPGAFMRVKIGAKKDGKMTAASAEIYFEAGAFPGSATGAAAEQMFTAYDIPNGEIDAYEVLVNKPHVNDYRAPGDTQVTFAMEQVVDELAERLAIDPLDLRILNVAREGSTSISGVVHNQIDALQVLEAAKKHPHYQNQPCKQNYGTGVAFAWWPNWGAQSSCAINVNYDGTLAMTTGSVDLSGTRLTIAMQAAEVLGVDVEDIKSSVVDTDSTGYNDPTGGSRVTYATGIAAVEAAKSVIRQLKERAAILWDVSAEKVEFEAGVFYAGTERMALRQLAQRQSETGGQVTGVANIDARGWGSGFGVHIADVSVDPETGKVQVVRYTAVQGVGKAIHPTLVEGQIQGGVAQGIGWALWEGYWYDAQGRMMNPNRLDYKQPTSLDLPHIEPVLVEVPGPNHPFGVRGVGEVPIVPPPATIANALRRATGKRLHKLPMTPDQILRVTGVIE